SPDEWTSLFDGRTLQGWKASENMDSWKIENGELITSGPRSHLFYVGDVMGHNFRNFEFMADVLTEPGANSGIYIHTRFQEGGWPEQGYECQVLNTYKPQEENKMTGSIYAIRNNWKSPVPDNVWFNYQIKVQGKTIQTFINGDLVAEYTEPEEIYRVDGFQGRVLSTGTLAIQCHDPESVVHYRNIRVKPLPDDLASPGTPPEDLAFEKKLIRLHSYGFPLLDLHVHLKGGLTQEDVLAYGRKYGFNCGLGVNCGLKMGKETDSELKEYIGESELSPLLWHAMQAEGREWVDLYSRENINYFDYVFTDAMTWTNDNGKRMRLWIPEETEIGNPEEFMEQLVTRIEEILGAEPIDIYVNPTYLPDELNDRYDELWTAERMDRVISALAGNGVALEINNLRRIPSPAFIKRAKEAGVKFTFGTNNSGADDLGRMDYAISMIDECDLSSDDMWMPHKN
ncbi:MAG: DUF1080 domain-containing protein, partial [Bacteroidetes bacterium]